PAPLLAAMKDGAIAHRRKESAGKEVAIRSRAIGVPASQIRRGSAGPRRLAMPLPLALLSPANLLAMSWKPMCRIPRVSGLDHKASAEWPSIPHRTTDEVGS